MPIPRIGPETRHSRYASTGFGPGLVLLLACLLYACGSEVVSGATPGSETPTSDVATGVDETENERGESEGIELHAYMRSAHACAQRIDTGHHLFHGCIDWHSAVHAHWAVLRHANRVERGAEANDIVARLRSAALAQERTFMNASPGFEMPYGRAWFLALALEYEQLTGGDELAGMATDIAASLRSWLAGRTIDPLIREYGNHGWALAQLLRYYRTRGDGDGSAWVEARVDTHYLDYDPGAALSIDRYRADFFSLWGNWAMLLGLRDPTALRAWLGQQDITETALLPITRANSAHQLGINPSRSWGLWWAFEASGDRRFEQAVEAHTRQMDDTHAKRQDDYGAYGHWVPQFVLYARTQSVD